MGMIIVEIKSLVKIYKSPFLMKKSIGVNGLDFEIEKGEIFGLLGPNGAGKTTTLKIIGGLLKPTSGKVTLFGKYVPKEARRRIGFLPENPSFYRHLTGKELLQFYARLYGKNLNDNEIEEKLEVVGLKDSMGKRISSYSKGMVQRIGFAQALIGDPELLILDEPLSGLDPIGRREIKDLIEGEKSKGKTILFSSHILSDVEAICSRVGIILNGRLKKVGSIREILKSDIRYIEIMIERFPESGYLEKYGEVRSEGKVIYLRLREETKRDKVIKEIIERGGKIISIVPVRLTLEEHFMKAINE
ncbi:MAG: ABC transporter ATP-binding protein [candidate division WOR-3 bacterium]|nr:ABC transporter ATP-binding protein [candidate division WOR-3 bacterium]